jgi:hypothetical protein
MIVTPVQLQMVRRPYIPKQFSSTAGAQEVRMGGEGSSTEFKKKILEEVKKLTNQGKHKEASELFKIYFPNFGEYTNGKS